MPYPAATFLIRAATLAALLAGCTTVNTTQQTNSAAVTPGGGGGLVASGQVARAPAPPPPRVAQGQPGRPPSPVAVAIPRRFPTEAEVGGRLPEEATTYRGSVPFLDGDVALPDGSWTVIARFAAVGPAGPTNVRVALARSEGSALTGLLILAGNPANKPFPNGLPLSAVCTGGDVITSDPRISEPFGNQDCANVDFRRSTVLLTGTDPIVRSIGPALDQRNISPPQTLVGTAFIVASKTHAIFGDVFFNPDLAGIAPDLATQRSQSGWAAFNVGKDPAKQAFVQRVLEWSRGWRDALKQTLAGGSPRLPPSVATTP